MASSIAASRGLLAGGLATKAASQNFGAEKKSVRFAPMHLQRSAFLAKNVRVPSKAARQVVRQRQTARAAIVPERAAETRWDVKRKALIDAKVRSVSGKEARRLIEQEGYRILDVRPDYEYKEAHPKDAINVQIYRLIQDWTPYKIVRRAGFAFFGIFKGTEENPNFIEDVRTAFPDKEAGVIVACSQGGSTRPTSNFPEGKQSRSLIAAYYLIVDGYKNVLHLDNGLQAYFGEQLPAVFADDN